MGRTFFLALCLMVYYQQSTFAGRRKTAAMQKRLWTIWSTW